MGLRIHQLPPAIANQIAAGEVIERPASVVKELLENSLDAGADVITIEIGYGGLNQIKISDNGSGIVAEDLPLAVAAHATSKITTLDDLYAIDSMGFRGEALASIASVAKVAISSRTAQQDHAMMLQVHNSNVTLSPCARNVGTTIDVVDLFFNAPVRKRFLKNEKLEFQAIEMVIKRFALSAPHIGLILKHNNKLVLSLPAAINEQAKQIRMTKIFGSAFIKDAIYLDVERGAMRLYGWISGPDFQRSQNDRQWVYINKRMVKDKLINHALKQTYDGLLYPGRFPACLLYFTISTAEVDVNVHPTKHEVRFQQPRLVHDFFTSQLTAALHSVTIKEEETVYEYNLSSDSEENNTVYEPHSYLDTLKITKTSPDTLSVSATPDDSFLVPVQSGVQISPFNQRTLSALGRHDKENKVIKVKNAVYSSADNSAWIILNNRYIVLFIKQQPHLVDVLGLQQLWLADQLDQIKFPLISRPLLVPIGYPVPLSLKTRMSELGGCLEQLGIHIEFKEDRVLFRSVPIIVPYLDLSLFLDSVAALKTLNIEQLIQVICQSQYLDATLLSPEERMELNHWLSDAQNRDISLQGISKVLSVDNCRMLLHV